MLVPPARETSTMVMTAPSILFDVVKEISQLTTVWPGDSVSSRSN